MKLYHKLLLVIISIVAIGCNSDKILVQVKIIETLHCESLIKFGDCVIVERQDTKERFIEFGHFGKVGDVFNLRVEK